MKSFRMGWVSMEVEIFLYKSMSWHLLLNTKTPWTWTLSSKSSTTLFAPKRLWLKVPSSPNTNKPYSTVRVATPSHFWLDSQIFCFFKGQPNPTRTKVNKFPNGTPGFSTKKPIPNKDHSLTSHAWKILWSGRNNFFNFTQFLFSNKNEQDKRT